MAIPLHFKWPFSKAAVGSEFPDPAEFMRIGKSALERGADFVEFYAEKQVSTLITVDEDKINTARKGYRQGVGVRVIRGKQMSYASCESMEEGRIREAVQQAAVTLDDEKGSWNKTAWRNSAVIQKSGSSHTSEMDDTEKVTLLRRANAFARDLDERIRNVNGTYYDEEKTIRIVNSDGICCDERRSLLSLHVFVLTEGKNGRSSGQASGGGPYSLEYFTTRTPEEIAKRAADQALQKLEARGCPAGLFPVVIHRGWGGVLMHEAVGHGLESDYIRKETSVYSGRIGEKIASNLVTLVDDGTLVHGRGSMNFDDEGIPAQKNILIENGILKNYLYDTFNARQMNKNSTGNARRENFTQAPMPRMTNTYIAAGSSDPAEIMRSVKKGLYAKSLGSGQVDVVTGNFVFEVQEGYWIENGRIAYPVQGATLIGNGPEILHKIIAVGNDLEIETGMGDCVKGGQTLPVGIGQPTILISAMTVGGTKIQ